MALGGILRRERLCVLALNETIDIFGEHSTITIRTKAGSKFYGQTNAPLSLIYVSSSALHDGADRIIEINQRRHNGRSGEKHQAASIFGQESHTITNRHSL